MSDNARFILVGHCGADCWSLSQTIEQSLPEAEIVQANNDSDLAKFAEDGGVWLVNRVLDGRFTARDGIDLIRTAKANDSEVTAVLISNYADAQQDAVNAGAAPGFGKSELNSTSTAELLRSLAAAAE